MFDRRLKPSLKVFAHSFLYLDDLHFGWDRNVDIGMSYVRIGIFREQNSTERFKVKRNLCHETFIGKLVSLTPSIGN